MPDEMPSSRICEGDLNVFMIMLEKLHGKIDEFGSAMAAISRDVELLITNGNGPPFRRSAIPGILGFGLGLGLGLG